MVVFERSGFLANLFEGVNKLRFSMHKLFLLRFTSRKLTSTLILSSSLLEKLIILMNHLWQISLKTLPLEALWRHYFKFYLLIILGDIMNLDLLGFTLWCLLNSLAFSLINQSLQISIETFSFWNNTCLSIDWKVLNQFWQ